MGRSIFVPTLLLTLIFLAAKLALAWPFFHSPRALTKWIGASGEDVAVAILLGIIASAIIRMLSRRPRLQTFAWWTFIVLAAAFGVYAVINVSVFRALGLSLNIRMFALVGRFSDMRSSIAQCATPGIVASIVLVVILFAIAMMKRFRILPSARAKTILLAIACPWIISSIALRTHAQPGSWISRAGKNPHREILASLVSSVFDNKRVDLGDQFPLEYLDDFRPAAAYSRPLLPQFTPRPRNVILIVLESTAAQYMSLYGSRFDTTPNLLSEAKHAMLFDRFYSNVGFTYRSMAPLSGSVYPGLPWRYRTDVQPPMSAGLAGALKQHGYRTAFLAAANPEWGGMNWMSQCAGFEQVIGPKELGGPEASSWGTEDGVLIDGLMQWIDSGPSKSKPFFAVAWTDQTHDPYTLSKDTQAVEFVESSSFTRASEMNRHLSALRQADHHIGRLFAFLRARNLADDTLIVVTGDHGEAFGDLHDVVGHGTGLFEECNRVPLMLWNPRLFGELKHNQTIGAHVDINPTLAHILGVDPPRHWQGSSLLSPDHPSRAYMFVDISDYQFAVADGRYKYVLHYTEDFERLYDLRDDPGETRDLSAQQPDRAAQMRGRIRAFVHAEERYLNENTRK